MCVTPDLLISRATMAHNHWFVGFSLQEVMGAVTQGGYSVEGPFHTARGGFEASGVGGRTHHGDPTQKTGSKKLSMALNGTRSDVGPPPLAPGRP